MNILLSAFACSPTTGSEGGVGWRWAVELAKNHSVTILTDISRKPDIDCYCQNGLPHGIKVVYHRPNWLRKVAINSRTAHLLYLCWQFSVLPLARQLHAEDRFDVVHHLTYGVFRHPSFLWELGTPFVFGPVGGGESAPEFLVCTLPWSDRLKEYVRDLVNVLARLDPFLRRCLRATDLLLVKTRETATVLPHFAQEKAVVAFEIGIDDRCVEQNLAVIKRQRVLFAGRLLGLKGVHLALAAIARISESHDVEFCIVGEGPARKSLECLTKRLGISDKVRWLGKLPQPELFALYPTAACVLFPSLHDSSGNVVLEALSFGVPVVCLDLGGPRELVTDECGIVVSTSSGRFDEVVEGLAAGVKSILSDTDRHAELSAGAVRRAAGMSWSVQINKCYERVDTLVRERQLSVQNSAAEVSI